MPLVLRKMHDAERPLVLDSWTRSFEVDARERTGGLRPETMIDLGAGSMLGQWLWYRAHRTWVALTLPRIELTIAADAKIDEAASWCAWEPPSAKFPLTVHYLYTTPSARRCGAGSTLLRHVLAMADDRGVQLTHLTESGRALLAALRRKAT